MAEVRLISRSVYAVGVVSFTDAGLSVICQPDPFLGLSVTGPAGKPLLFPEMHMCLFCALSRAVRGLAACMYASSSCLRSCFRKG